MSAISNDSPLDFLAETQNPDGGWGYFPAKSSWLEPTVYALMALHPSRLHEANFRAGWELMRSWQLASGAWRPARQVMEAHWTTALCVTLHALRGVFDTPFQRGLSWLLGVRGAENGFFARVIGAFVPQVNEYDPSLTGWPWLPETSSWVEPTAHALLALKMSAPQLSVADHRETELGRRCRQAERMLFERRCRDGGWNYGNRKVYGADLASYPETTAIALLGLKGSRSPALAPSLAAASRMLRETQSPFARAWLTIGLRAHAVVVGPEERAPNADILLTAVQALARNRLFG